jgi:hypothetical protein
MMAKARKRGFFRRLGTGWVTGLVQFDPLVCGATALCAGLLATNVYVVANPPPVPHPVVDRACAPGAATLAGIKGRLGWIVGKGTATMTAGPGYALRNRILFPFTPVVVRGSAGGAVLVTAYVPSTGPATGYISSKDVQFDDPTADAVSEQGRLVVRDARGTGLRVGPDLEAPFYGTARQGEELHEIGKIHMGWLTDTQPSDWYLVEVAGASGCHYAAWVAKWQVKRLASP